MSTESSRLFFPDLELSLKPLSRLLIFKNLGNLDNKDFEEANVLSNPTPKIQSQQNDAEALQWKEIDEEISSAQEQCFFTNTDIEHSRLHKACYFKLPNVVRKILALDKSQLNSRDNRLNFSPLHFTLEANGFIKKITSEAIEVIKILLSAGAVIDKDFKTISGDTVLHMAARVCSVTAIQLILAHPGGKTCLDETNKNGFTPIGELFVFGFTNNDNPQDHLTAVSTFIEQGVNVNKPFTAVYQEEYFGSRITNNLIVFYPIHLAAEKGTLDMVIALIQTGANIHVQSLEKETSIQKSVVDHALEGYNLDIAEILVSMGGLDDLPDTYSDLSKEFFDFIKFYNITKALTPYFKLEIFTALFENIKNNYIQKTGDKTLTAFSKDIKLCQEIICSEIANASKSLFEKNKSEIQATLLTQELSKPLSRKISALNDRDRIIGLESTVLSVLEKNLRFRFLYLSLNPNGKLQNNNSMAHFNQSSDFGHIISACSKSHSHKRYNSNGHKRIS